MVRVSLLAGLSLASPIRGAALLPSDSSVVTPASVGDELGLTSKIFCLGSSKSGVKTLEAVFKAFPNDFKPCVERCGPSGKQWFDASREEDDAAFSQNRVFLGGGQTADFAWLDKHFDAARFVLNQRRLREYILSRYDEVKDNRLRAGCIGEGTTKDCKKGKDSDGKQTYMVDNSEGTVRSWVKEVADSEKKIKEYFAATPERKARFVAVDVVHGRQEDTVARLLWVSRALPGWKGQGPVPDEILTIDKPLPGEAMAHYVAVAAAANATGGVALQKLGCQEEAHVHGCESPHSDESISAVGLILNAAGCGTMYDHLDYAQCADAMTKFPDVNPFPTSPASPDAAALPSSPAKPAGDDTLDKTGSVPVASPAPSPAAH